MKKVGNMAAAMYCYGHKKFSKIWPATILGWLFNEHEIKDLIMKYGHKWLVATQSSAVR